MSTTHIHVIPMKTIIISILAILFFGNLIGQTDHNGNPVFNSIRMADTVLGEYELVSSYYTMKNNLEDSRSSVYIADNPSLDQVESAALKLGAEFFILTKKQFQVALIFLRFEPNREFMSIAMASNKEAINSCKLEGDITENRANELIKENYDSKAKIKKGYLKFNKNTYKIISNKDIIAAVIDLIEKEKLDEEEATQSFMPNKQDYEVFILEESKEGGKLDFFTEIKGKENDGIQIKQGLFTTLQGVALYKWGRACFDIGVNTVEDVYEVYGKFKGKVPTQRDKDYLKRGFYRELEK